MLPCDANPVIRKSVVHTRNLDLGHMAIRTIHLAHLAHEVSWTHPLLQAKSFRVAMEADLIIMTHVVNQGLVRVVTRDTG